MIQFSLVSKTIWDFEIHFIQLLEFNNYVRQKITIFLDHNFPFYQNQEFLFCWLAWYYLVKKIVFFRYFSIKTNKSIVTDFVITNTCSPRTYRDDWFVLQDVLLQSVTIDHLNFHYRSLLLLKWHIRFLFLSRCYLIYPRFFFLSLIWLNVKHFPCFKLSLYVLLIWTLAPSPWCSGYHYGTTSFNKAWTDILCRLKSCSRHARDFRWWESLTVVPAGNKT